MAHPFDRYAAFTDLKLLLESSGRPLRKSKRVNTLKCSVEEFKHWAKAKNWTIEPVPWCPEGFFIERENRDEVIGKDLLHILGYTYLQEAASMLPVELLDPKPGENILDMSAAPGSKSTQIAAALTPGPSPEGRGEKGGLLVANDVQEKRIWALLNNLQRCGVVNMMVTKKVGQWFAGNMTEKFDRVLCDAPCTAQGTVRKDSDSLNYCSMDNIGKMARLQRELLESAVHAAKVGGRIVYSTCTLTPEENEGVILSILNKYSDQVFVLDPREIAGSRQRSAISYFDRAIEDSIKVQGWLISEKKKSSQLTAHSSPLLRFWPQTADTEGFFTAVLGKRAPTNAATKKFTKEDFPRFEIIPHSKQKEITSKLLDCYGTGFLRDDELLIAASDQLHAIPDELLKLRIPAKPFSFGLPFGKTTTYGMVRLSHEMATLRGHGATRQILIVSMDELKAAFQGKNLSSNLKDLEDGDLLLAIRDPGFDRPIIIGRGLLKEGKILNRLPRDIVRMFT